MNLRVLPSAGRRGLTLIELLLGIAIIGGIWYGVAKWQGIKVKAAAAKAEAEKPVTIKGFYIGMHTNELRSVVESSFDNTWHFDHSVNLPDWFMVTKPGEARPGDGWALAREEKQVNIQYDLDGRVIAFSFNKYATDAVFDAASQGANEFSQNFVDAYHTSPMKPDGTAWVYIGRGVKIRVTTSKEISVEQFSNSAARAKFN